MTKRKQRPPRYLTEWDRRHAQRTARRKLVASLACGVIGAAMVFAGVLGNLPPFPVLAASLWTFAACIVAGVRLGQFHRARP